MTVHHAVSYLYVQWKGGGYLVASRASVCARSCSLFWNLNIDKYRLQEASNKQGATKYVKHDVSYYSTNQLTSSVHIWKTQLVTKCNYRDINKSAPSHSVSNKMKNNLAGPL